MRNSRRVFYWGIAVVLVLIVILLAVALWPRIGVQNARLISRETAIQDAIAACNPSYGLQPLETPTAIRAELTTYGKAVSNSEGWPPDVANRPVWVVDLKGKWLLLGGPPPPTDQPNMPHYFVECTQVIDAITGQSLLPPIQ